MKHSFLAVVCLAATTLCKAQTAAPPTVSQQTPADLNARLMETARTQANLSQARDYRIGAEDLIEITVFEVPELSRSVRVSAAGDISLPLIGSTRAAGLSPLELEQSITRSLQKNYVKDPQVSVFLKEYRSDPVSVVGAVKVPGLYQIQTQRSLIELLAMAQGFSESQKMLPGRTIVITHKPRTATTADEPNPADAAQTAQWAQVEEVPIKALLESGDSKWNVPVYPGDVIKVVPAGTFYVAGDVNQPGAFALADFDDVSSIQAVAMAGGSKKTASLKDSVIIRRDAAGERTEEKIDLKRVLQGKATDVRLGANDILFIPGSMSKEAGLRGIEAAIQVATGVLIWGL